jgi:ferrous iron transport protein A
MTFQQSIGKETKPMRFFGWASSGHIKHHNHHNRTGLYLDTSTKGETYVMVGFDGGTRFREKIYSMGLNPGVKFTIIQNSGSGPIEIEVRHTKLAIGRGMAARIKIKENGSAG